MTQSRKIITTSLWSLLLLAMVGVVVGKVLLPRFRGQSPMPEAIGQVSAFSLTDQNSAAFTSDTLKGKPYVATFMFTKCAGICPRMNTVITKLQQDLPLEFQIVSFSVDPGNDTPAVLKQYAQTYKADESRWHFLTGDVGKISDVATSMMLSTKDWPAGHTDRIMLIDGSANIRGTYHVTDPESIQKLLIDAQAVVRNTRSGS